jgi:hypothetical protein
MVGPAEVTKPCGSRSVWNRAPKRAALAEEFGKGGEAKFIPITFKKHWEVIRKIDAATNVSYDCQ